MGASASKTIESVLPLMISLLKEMHPPHEALLLASKDFLCVFTEAMDRVPRHHRTRSVFAFSTCLIWSGFHTSPPPTMWSNT